MKVQPKPECNCSIWRYNKKHDASIAKAAGGVK